MVVMTFFSYDSRIPLMTFFPRHENLALPRRFAEFINPKGEKAEEERAPNEERLEDKELARFKLTGREKAEEETERGADDPKRTHHPDSNLAKGDFKNPLYVGLFIVENEGGEEHQHIHYHVENCSEGDERPVGAIH